MNIANNSPGVWLATDFTHDPVPIFLMLSKLALGKL